MCVWHGLIRPWKGVTLVLISSEIGIEKYTLVSNLWLKQNFSVFGVENFYIKWSTSHWTLELIFMFIEQMEPGEWETTQCSIRFDLLTFFSPTPPYPITVGFLYLWISGVGNYESNPEVRYSKIIFFVEMIRRNCCNQIMPQSNIFYIRPVEWEQQVCEPLSEQE